MIMNPIYTLLLSLPLLSSSFAPAARLSLAKNGVPSNSLSRPTAGDDVIIGGSSSSSALMAKKRRRRKEASPAPTTQSSDELPDFVDTEAEDFEEEKIDAVSVESPMKAAAASLASSPNTQSTPIRRGAGLDATLAEEVGGNVDGLASDTIMEAMRGKSNAGWQPPRNIAETLGDRSLEKFMDFDKMIEADGGADDVVDLPDFEEVISRRKQRETGDAMQEGRVQDVAMMMESSGMGKKAARNMQRKAEALQREQELEEEKNPFEGVNALKFLENGAWVGIGLLVLWEVYINSPLFDRASPIIPVVYDLDLSGYM